MLECELISCDVFVDATREDLVSQYIGQTGHSTCLIPLTLVFRELWHQYGRPSRMIPIHAICHHIGAIKSMSKIVV